MIEILGSYFADKGKVMTQQEYKEAEDAPIKYQVLKGRIGSWGRIVNMVNKQVTVSMIVDIVEAAPVAEPVAEEEPVKSSTKSKKG